MELKPTLTPEGCLRVDFVSARIGQLPLPLKTALRFIPRDMHRLGHNMELDLTAPTPRINLDLADDGPNAPSIHSIQCQQGAVTIELLAPVLKRQQDDRDSTPLVVSDPDSNRTSPG